VVFGPIMPVVPEVRGEMARGGEMENRLLLPTDGRKKKNRWGGRLMKRIFQRNKRQPEQTLTSESELNEDHSKFFASLKDGFDELDLTTVNLSFSGGSVPYSTDDSLEVDRRRRKKFSSPAGTSTSRSSDVSFNSDPLDASRMSHGGFSQVENTFAQLDVPSMQKSKGRNTPVPFEGPSSSSDDVFESSFVIHTRSTLDQSRVLEDTCPLGSSDDGMEVVLFDQEEDNMEDGIFMTFQSPADDEWRDPFNISIVDQNNISATFSSTKPSPPRCMNLKSLLSDEPDVPPSPALSQQSETSVTWVSHDDDDGDERPMKEIIFPVLSDGVDDDLFLDCESLNALDNSNAVKESLAPRESLVRAEIFTQMELTNAEKTNLCKSPVFDASLGAASPYLLNSSGAISPRSAFTPRSPTLADPTTRLLPLELNSNPSLFIEIDASENQSSFNPAFPKTPSSAFLKRKSAFTGEDLLSQEAESFAEFLEEGRSTTLETVVPGPVEAQPPLVTPKTPISAAQRLLHAMKSLDASDDEGEIEEIMGEPEDVASPTIVSDVDVGPLFLQAKDGEIPLTHSVDLSQSGVATLQSYTTGHTASTTMFSKSLSEDEADDEEFTNNASISYASSTSYTAPSTLQGSLTGGRKIRQKKSAGISHLPYCGVFIREDIEEDEEDFDDMSLPSEEDSCPPETSRRHLRLRQSSTRSETPLLDQVRNEFLETVQDLAREGSSAVRSFLRTRT
jgi:hypothetical protein